MMIFRAVKTTLFAFFALIASAGPAACACCAVIDGGHAEKLHGKSFCRDNAQMAYAKPIVFMPEHHSGGPGAPCDETCRQYAPVYVYETDPAEPFSVATGQPIEKSLAANAAARDWRGGLSEKPLASGGWRAPPGKTPIDLKIRLLI